MRILLLIILFNSILLCDVYYYSYGKKTALTPMKNSREVNSTTTYYLNSAGQKIGVKNDILAKCKQNKPCKKIFEKYNFKQIKAITSNLFLITLNNDQNLFTISQKLYMEEYIDFAHPNFIKKRYRR